MDTITKDQLVFILQLASPALPVGAYSYSEGLEYLIEEKVIKDKNTLSVWLEHELKWGSIRLETGVMLRVFSCVREQDLAGLNYWNGWLSAARETEELRLQSWQMGQSLLKLLLDLNPDLAALTKEVASPCNYAVAMAIAATVGNISSETMAISYLHSWVTNLITAGVKLIPLGQTAGQQLLYSLHPLLLEVSQELLNLKDDDLSCCSWGLALASMRHQTQYTRLFRS